MFIEGLNDTIEVLRVDQAREGVHGRVREGKRGGERRVVEGERERSSLLMVRCGSRVVDRRRRTLNEGLLLHGEWSRKRRSRRCDLGRSEDGRREDAVGERGRAEQKRWPGGDDV